MDRPTYNRLFTSYWRLRAAINTCAPKHRDAIRQKLDQLFERLAYWQES